jgi:hypothetical protein
MQASLFPYHDLNQNHSKPKAFQNQNFNSDKLCIHPITLYKWTCVSRSQTPFYILIKRKQVKKLPKTYPSQGSSNNQKETKSQGNIITWCTCDSTINHKETISHGAHDFHISQCTMTKLWNPITQLTPLNNYLSNCVITSSYTSTLWWFFLIQSPLVNTFSLSSLLVWSHISHIDLDKVLP